MQKIPTLFERNPDDRRYVLDKVNPAAAWVLAGEGRATRKYDGTCVMLDQGGNWWARREVKLGRRRPDGFVEISHDETTGKTVGWEPIYQSPFMKAWDEAWTIQRESGEPIRPGTFELCGPKVNGNPEQIDHHMLIPHGCDEVPAPRTFAGLAVWLHEHPWEGVVWHHLDGRMAKVKRRDFRGDGAHGPGRDQP